MPTPLPGSNPPHLFPPRKQSAFPSCCAFKGLHCFSARWAQSKADWQKMHELTRSIAADVQDESRTFPAALLRAWEMAHLDQLFTFSTDAFHLPEDFAGLEVDRPPAFGLRPLSRFQDLGDFIDLEEAFTRHGRMMTEPFPVGNPPHPPRVDEAAAALSFLRSPGTAGGADWERLARLRADCAPHIFLCPSLFPELEPQPLADVVRYRASLALLERSHLDFDVPSFFDRSTLTIPWTEFMARFGAWLAAEAADRRKQGPEQAGQTAAGEPYKAPLTPRDGPGPRLHFFWRGDSVQLSPLRIKLCEALWDAARGLPHDDRVETAVIAQIYDRGSKTSGTNLKNLVLQVNEQFECKGWSLRVKRSGGKIWLEASP